MSTFDYIVKKFKVDLEKSSPAMLAISREVEFPDLLKEMGMKKGVELGVFAGEYSEVLMNRIPGLDLTAIDAWKIYKEYKDYKRNETMTNAYNETKRRAEKMGFKILPEWSVEASKQFADESLDFIYIDSNHDFAHVVEDLNAWSPKVKKGGIISGHDFFESKDARYGVLYAVPAWCAYSQVPTFFVMTHDQVPSWFYVKQ
jgi:hypothetical protein